MAMLRVISGRGKKLIWFHLSRICLKIRRNALPPLSLLGTHVLRSLLFVVDLVEVVPQLDGPTCRCQHKEKHAAWRASKKKIAPGK